MKNPRTYDDTYQTFGDSSENSRHSKYLRIPILLQTTHHCRLIDNKSPGSAFHTVTAVKSDKTRQKDRQMTTYGQTAAETSSSNKMPSETRSDGIFAQLRQGLKPPANQIVL